MNDIGSPVRKVALWWAIMITLAVLPFVPRVIDYPPEVYEYRSVTWHVVANAVGALWTFVMGAMIWLTIRSWNLASKQPGGLVTASAWGITLIATIFGLLGMVSGMNFWLLDVIVQTLYGWHWT